MVEADGFEPSCLFENRIYSPARSTALPNLQNWSLQLDSNKRTLPYEGSALPLSYVAMVLDMEFESMFPDRKSGVLTARRNEL